MSPGADTILLSLITVLRRTGVRVGTSETHDALRAGAAVGWTDPETLRAALAATLVKREEDRARFDRVFDGFFRGSPAEPSGVREALAAEGMSDAELEAASAAIGAGAGAGGGLAALMQGGAELAQRIESALAAADVRSMQSPMQVGLVALRALEALEVDAMETQLRERGAALPARVREALAHAIEALRRRVRARVREDFERANPERLARSRAARLDGTTLSALSRDEVEQVRREVERLGHLLRDRLERRRRRVRRGRLDVRSTARAALRTGGVPFTPVFRRRRRDRPKLVVLCDISDSVRAAARFLLVLVYAMQEAFSRTRSFVFVRDVGEVTALFAAHPIDVAVQLAFAGDAVPVGANSDYGRALGQMAERHLDAIDRQTTVVVLGDARSNYLDPNLEAFEAMHRRAARILWLNPEPRASWGFGDSEMERYRRLSSVAAPVRTLAELRHAMERLATSLTR